MATLAVLPGMRRRGWGHIVHISSVGGRVPVPHLAPYTTAKYALTGFSEAARAELSTDSVASSLDSLEVVMSRLPRASSKCLVIGWRSLGSVTCEVSGIGH